MENLLDLPEEVLLNILKFLPYRFDYASVCKKFYELICEIDKFKYNLTIRTSDDKLRTNLIDKVWVTNTCRKFDEINVYLEIQNADHLDLLKHIIEVHGQTAKYVEWLNWTTFVFQDEYVLKMLNLMPNLETLHLALNMKFSNDQQSPKKSLNLHKLRKLKVTEYNEFTIDFLERNLPKNILKELKIVRSSSCQKIFKISFLSSQKSVQKLSIDVSEFLDAEPFDGIKLKTLQCVMATKGRQKQEDFLKALIESQPELVSLNIKARRYNSFGLNDDIFREIVECQFLESLKLNIDGISAFAVGNIKKLKKLRFLELHEIKLESSFEVFNELSLLKLPVETLVLELSNFDIFKSIYTQFGENFNLNSLIIKSPTWHSINFFIESFPKLESLIIEYNEVEWSRFLDEEDLKIHSNMKTLSLNLDIEGAELLTSENFLTLLSCFPKLEKLKIHSKILFTPEFFTVLSSFDLNLIKNLDISDIMAYENLSYSQEIIESLIKVSTKFDFCSLYMEYDSPEDNPSYFAPLGDALKHYFRTDIGESSLLLETGNRIHKFNKIS